MIEIWRMKPEPRRVTSVAEDLFWKYLSEREERYKYDLGTDWFGRMMATLFNYVPNDYTESFSFVDVTGASRTKNIKTRMFIYNSTTAVDDLLNTYQSDVGAFIGVGTGTNPPGKQDYKLTNEVARQSAQGRYVDGSSYFSVLATFTLSANTDITEVGLYYKTGYTSYYVLLDHTLLSSPVTFPANTPMVVVYNFSI
jgi:hypothetical protein